MKEMVGILKKKLDDHEARISKLEAVLTRPVEKGKKGKGKRKKGKGKRKKGPSASGRPGPGAMIDQLIAKGFFKKHRVMVDIIKHCKNNLAYRYKATDFSPTLGRCIRNEKLKREKNKDGHFEYFQQ